jgi:hypothetical protein
MIDKLQNILTKLQNGEELTQDEALVLKTETQNIQEITEPMIKSVGGEPDMKPEKAKKLTGELSSPDLEEMDKIINYEDYLKKKKRQFGYE